MFLGLACIGMFMAVISIVRIVSLSSVVVSLVASLMVLWRHRSNIERLMAGTEPKIGQKA